MGNAVALNTEHRINTAHGWNGTSETWTFSSVDDPTGIITVPSDATDKYNVGIRIKFTNDGNVIYGIITAVTSTTITFLHEIDPSDSQALHLMADSAITANFYSNAKAPTGFLTDPRKWTIEVSDTSRRVQASPTQNVWYNLGGVSADIPLGLWQLGYGLVSGIANDTSPEDKIELYVAMSTSSSSVSDTEYTQFVRIDGSAMEELLHPFDKSKIVELASKTTYYVLTKTTQINVELISNFNDVSKLTIKAICAYL